MALVPARRLWPLVAVTVGAAGCGTVSPERGHDQVASVVEQRTGRRTRWEKGPPDDARVAEWVRAQVTRGLTRTRAVEIALVNSPELQATYEELGISQADMVQAGLLRNPSFGVELGFRTNSGARDELRLSLVQDFLDLLVLPLRKQLAREQFEADTLRVAHQALEVAAHAEQDLIAVAAAAELVTFRRTVVEAAGAAAELAGRQFEAGNISALDLTTQRSAAEQARLELARDELALLEARERVNRLLGLWGEATTWTLAEPLPPLPAGEPPLEHLESMAIRQRLDVAVARRRARLLAKAVDLARSTRLFGYLEVGVDAHQDPDGPRVLGPNLVIELPIFDQRQAVIARLEAQHREQERRLAGVAIEARSEVRLAEARLRAARQSVIHHRDVLLPLRKSAAEEALLHYNGMFISLYQLVDIKQAEVDTRRGYLESLRDYWTARAELARALGGALPGDASRAKAPPANTNPKANAVTQPQAEGE